MDLLTASAALVCADLATNPCQKRQRGRVALVGSGANPRRGFGARFVDPGVGSRLFEAGRYRRSLLRRDEAIALTSDGLDAMCDRQALAQFGA